jgi:hypothetical protein
MSDYRELVVQKVNRYKRSIDIKFHNSIISMSIHRIWLKDRNVDPRHITPGRHILVRGIHGNNDMDLWGIDVLENLVLMPKI